MGTLSIILLVFIPLLNAMELVPVQMAIREWDNNSTKHNSVQRQSTKEKQAENKQMKCYSVTEASEFCAAFLETNDISMESRQSEIYKTDHSEINFDELVDTLSKQREDKPSANKTNANWRHRLTTMEERFTHLQQKGVFTDCAFLVGPNNNTQLFRAHKLVMASASPVLESVLSATNTVRMPHIRITGVRPEVFKTFIEFIYTGRVCLENFDKACDLLHAANRLQVMELSQYCRSYLWGKIYPNNVWRGYQCGDAVKDEEIKEAALQIAQWKTQEVLKDPSFTDIPVSTLVALLQKDELSVTSELQLYEASLRWAMVAAVKAGKPQDPASLKKVLGPALGYIRFLTLTPKEFTESQISSKILNYTETLAILFNFNAPGSMPLPENLSMNTNPRTVTNSSKYFEVIATNLEKHSCRKQFKNIILNKNSFDVYASFDFSINKNFTLSSIEIPSQVKTASRQLDFDFDNNIFFDLSDTNSYEEHITVNIISKKTLLYSVPFKSDVQFNSLITLPFTDSYILKYHKNDPSSNMYKIKFIFHKSGKYPSQYSKPKPGTSIYTIENRRHKIIWYPDGDNFVYSMSYF